MSLEKRLYRDEFNEPVLVVRVRGIHDVYRFAWHLQFGQCEFAAIGRRAHESLRRFLGARGWKALKAYFGGEPRLMASEELRVAAKKLLATVEEVPDEELAPEMLALRAAIDRKPRVVPSMWAKPA